MGDDKLKLIAHELLVSLRENVSVDWAHRDSARARMRVLVKRILRKYGFPPDLQDAAVQTVLQQAEALSSGWNVSRVDLRQLPTPPKFSRGGSRPLPKRPHKTLFIPKSRRRCNLLQWLVTAVQ